MGNRYRTRSGNSNNSDASAIKSVIQEIAQSEIQKCGFPTYKAAVVQKINEDGTVDVYLPPNKENLVTGVLNKCGELLFVNDSVEIATKNGSLTNCWVAIKHGTVVQGQAEEVEELSGEVVMKVQNGRLSVTELKRDAALGNAFTIIAEDINLDGMNIVLNGSRGITITSPYFSVTKEGYITATGGTIGGWHLNEQALYTLNQDNSYASYLGSAGITATIGGTSRNNIVFKAGNNFGVNSSGIIYAKSSVFTDIDATGTITATGGTIGGCAITNGSLSVDNAHIASGLNASKITAGTMSADRIYGGTIDGNNVNVTNLSASNIKSGTLSADRISGGTISSSSLSVGGSSYYLKMGTSWTKHPEVSGLNVTGGGGINVNNLGFNSDGSSWTFSGTLNCPYIVSTGYVRTNRVTCSSGNSVNICAGGSSGTASGGGVLIRNGSGHITLDAANGGGYVYASGSGVSNSKVTTGNGQASSRNTKTNIKKFTQDNYDKALNLLENIDIYSYDYKYDLYLNRHQYGFIIDEVEKQDNYDEFFDFTSEKAKVFDEHLDFSMEEGDDQDKIITVKQYDRDVFTKYLLTCLKALQDKINKQDEEMRELKEMIKNIT